MKNQDEIKTIHLADYREPNFWAHSVRLLVELDPDATLVTSTVRYEHNPGRPRSLELAGKDLKLLEVKLNGKILDPQSLHHDAHALHLHELPESFDLQITTSICPRTNTALEGLYLSQGKFYTQCESNGFRRITYYQDRPDVMAEFYTTIIADEQAYPILLSNGNLLEKGKKANGKHFAVWHDPFPKPSYLFALVAGDLSHVQDHFTTRSGKHVDLFVYVEKENLQKCSFAFEAIKKAMKWDEDVYDLEYDLGTFMIVAVSDFNMGAMENKGLNIFNAKYVLASPETATDRDFESILGVVGHEYFHNWTGNRVTLRDWFQLSLKEGLTVFRDQEFSADQGSRAVKRIQDVKGLREHQFREDSSPMAHPVRPDSYIEINNFYTPTVYSKGAEIVRMLFSLVGADAYYKAMRLYFDRFDGKAVTIEDLLAVMTEVSGKDLKQFKLWYQQSGTPIVRAKLEASRLTLEQILPPTPGQSEKRPQLIPISVAFLDAQGRPLISGIGGKKNHEHLLELTQWTQTFDFEDLTPGAIPSLLRGFSAPVKLESYFSRTTMLTLLAHDSDAFNKYEAAQSLATQFIKGHGADPQTPLDADYIAAFKRMITDHAVDPRLRALSMQTPSIDYLAHQDAVANVEAIFFASDWLQKELARACKSELLKLYKDMENADPMAMDKVAIGRRELRNSALSLLAVLSDSDVIDLLRQHYKASKNMTDAAAALSALASQKHPAREECLLDFYRNWEHDALVIDKWFAIQASSNHPDVLDHVQALLVHPDFDIFNPNRVYSIFRQFARCNPHGFHHVSGKGYTIVADYVIKIDRGNPQVAAMLAGLLSHYRRFDSGRQKLMLGALRRIEAHKPLSSDVFEVISKSLKD